jgi:hypothetical protein
VVATVLLDGSDVRGSKRVSKHVYGSSAKGSFKSHRFATGDCKDTDTVSTKLADSQAYEACTKSQAYPPRLARVGVLKSPTEKVDSRRL